RCATGPALSRPAKPMGEREGPGSLRRFVLLLVVDLLEIGVDHLVVRLAARRAATRATGPGSACSRAAGTASVARAGAALARRLARLVHRLAELHRELAERL